MDKYRLQWAGAPCGQHGSYTFYKAVKFYKNRRWRIVSLGEFFFLKFSETDPLCIGELQLLWEDRASDGLMLSSSRFYYLPESTPDGRQQNHGDDEVIAVDGKAIFKLEDLMDWVCTDVEWNRGSVAICSKDVKGGPPCNNNNGQLEDFALNNSKLNYADVKQEKKLIGDDDNKGQVKILSFPDYCRYKTVLKRLENYPDGWLNDAMVRALGGFTVPHRGTRLMYCKEEFEHPELAFHEKLCDHKAPNLKGRPRKKKLSVRELTTVTKPASEESTPSIPEPPKEPPKVLIKVEKIPQRKLKKLKRGRKHKRKKRDIERQENSSTNKQLDPTKTKSEDKEVKKGRKSMESHLLAFMKSRNTPITRVPNLGFKKIDIGLFWKMGQKLGGYDAICKKKLWKKIYDKLGGSPESTSAATCTRRHYERLILPYERHLKGLGHLPLPQTYQRPRSKDDQDDEDDEENDEDQEENQEEDGKMEDNEEQLMSKEDAEEEKSRIALMIKKKRPKEKSKKLKDQLMEMREKRAQMSLQPILTKDNHFIPGLSPPPTGASISSIKPDLSGVMADQAVLIPNVSRQGPVVSGIPTIKSEGPVILTIPSLSHAQMMNSLPGGIASNAIKTEVGTALPSDKTKNLFPLPHLNGMSGVITKASIIPPTSQPPVAPQSPVIIKKSSPQPNLSLPSSMLPLHSAMSPPIMTSSQSSRTQSSPVRGLAATSRPSVIQHTQHAMPSPFMRPGMVHPSDLLLRQASHKAHLASTSIPDQTGSSQDPIIVTPVNPYLPRLPGMPPMMLHGQLPFPTHHPTLPIPEPPSQTLNNKRRRTESGKENLDGKSSTSTANTNLLNIPPHQMPFFPVSVPLPVPRLVPPTSFQSLPEQDEPCDLSMPKKRKHDDDRHVIKERKSVDNSTLPHVKHGTKHRSSVDYPSDLLHRTYKMEERYNHIHKSDRHRLHSSHVKMTSASHSSHAKMTSPPHSSHAKMTSQHSSHVKMTSSPHSSHVKMTSSPHSSHVKMTPAPRGSITQGVINPPHHQDSISNVQRDFSKSLSVKVSQEGHITHTSTIASLASDHKPINPAHLAADIHNHQHLLAAAAASASRFPHLSLPFLQPHLLPPAQLLANLPPNFPLNEEFLRRNAGAFLFQQSRFPTPGLVGGALSPPQIKKEGQPAYASFHN